MKALNYAVSEGVMTSKMNVGSETIGDHGNCVFHINSVVELCGKTDNYTGSPGLSILEKREGGREGGRRTGRSLYYCPSLSPLV